MARKSTKTDADNQAAEQLEHIDNPDMTNKSPASPDVASVEYMAYTRSRCGGALRLAREKQGLSIHDVASKLKISNRQIEAIEADQFADLPESTIVRGFIRNYAKLLKIEAEPLLDAYAVLVPNKQPLAFTVKPSSSMKVSQYEKPKTARNFSIILLILSLMALWYFYENYIDKPNPTVPIAGGESLEPLPQPALPAAERVEQSIDIPLPANTAQPLEAPNVANINNEQISSENTVNSAEPVKPMAGMAKLEINANQETWVSVVDETGKEIYNKIIFAGSRDNLDVKLPVNVVIGNAGGTTVSMNNKLVDLGPHTRSNVARIQLEKLESSPFE